jgi:hypothetical protein
MRLFPVAFAVVLIAFPAFAQEEDGETGSSDPQCELSTNWRVIGTEIGDDPGMIMDVNKRDASGQPDCKTKDVKPDFTVGGADQALWMTSLSSDYLVMAQSTGPVGNVVIENLTDKSIAVNVTSNDSQADSWGVTYWEQKEAATADNCPEFADFTAQGFAAVIAHEMRYDFATKTILTSGKTSCEAQQ